jgi:hypothetical protein
VLHQSDDPVGHELGRPDRSATSGDFSDGYLASAGRNLDASTRSGGSDLIRAHVVSGLDGDLNAVTLHARYNAALARNSSSWLFDQLRVHMR